jgi:hypothetical protein
MRNLETWDGMNTNKRRNLDVAGYAKDTSAALLMTQTRMGPRKFLGEAGPFSQLLCPFGICQVQPMFDGSAACRANLRDTPTVKTV